MREPLILQPGQTMKIGPVVFSPTSPGTFRAHVRLRNNLTGISLLRLHGVGQGPVLGFYEPYIASVSGRTTRGERVRGDVSGRALPLTPTGLLKVNQAKQVPSSSTVSGGKIALMASVMMFLRNDGNSLLNVTKALLLSKKGDDEVPIPCMGLLSDSMRLPQSSSSQPPASSPEPADEPTFWLMGCESFPFTLQPHESAPLRLLFNPNVDWAASLKRARSIVFHSNAGNQQLPIGVHIPEDVSYQLTKVRSMYYGDLIFETLVVVMLVGLALFVLVWKVPALVWSLGNKAAVVASSASHSSLAASISSFIRVSASVSKTARSGAKSASKSSKVTPSKSTTKATPSNPTGASVWPDFISSSPVAAPASPNSVASTSTAADASIADDADNEDDSIEPSNSINAKKKKKKRKKKTGASGTLSSTDTPTDAMGSSVSGNSSDNGADSTNTSTNSNVDEEEPTTTDQDATVAATAHALGAVAVTSHRDEGVEESSDDDDKDQEDDDRDDDVSEDHSAGGASADAEVVDSSNAAQQEDEDDLEDPSDDLKVDESGTFSEAPANSADAAESEVSSTSAIGGSPQKNAQAQSMEEENYQSFWVPPPSLAHLGSETESGRKSETNESESPSVRSPYFSSFGRMLGGLGGGLPLQLEFSPLTKHSNEPAASSADSLGFHTLGSSRFGPSLFSSFESTSMSGSAPLPVGSALPPRPASRMVRPPPGLDSTHALPTHPAPFQHHHYPRASSQPPASMGPSQSSFFNNVGDPSPAMDHAAFYREMFSINAHATHSSSATSSAPRYVPPHLRRQNSGNSLRSFAGVSHANNNPDGSRNGLGDQQFWQ